MQRFSIKREFDGAHVFLTGCTGYVGGLVLESILRTTRVARVYVLLRAKKGMTAQERCDKVLQGPTFHLVRDKPDLLSKVTAVAGDLGEPNLGLSASDAEALSENVEIMIHSAADIRLEAPIQETMRANYVGTQRVLRLALQLRRLRSAVHVSTCYVNINHKPGSTVHERIYPLKHGEVEVDGEEIAQELLCLSKEEADRRADFYTRHWGFPNTYCLGKHLAEQMVYRTQKATGLPIAILRPSLVTGVAGLPWPGHCGNWAGPSGMGAAVAIGFFPAVSAQAVFPYSVWDAVPGDMAASAILATAAAVACGLSRAISQATGSGAWVGEGPSAGAGAPALAEAAPSALAAIAEKGRRAASSLGGGPAAPRVLIPAGAAAEEGGAASGSAAPSSPSTLSVGSDEPPAAPAAAPVAARAARGCPLIIVHAATSTLYPATVFEAYNTTVDFLKAHPSPTSLCVGGSKYQPYMAPTWQPSPGMVKFWKFYNGVKVAIVCFLLRLFGLQRAAQKLSIGYQQWAMNNDFKNDTNLLFACPALRQLHARLEPSERLDYLLTFAPPRGPAKEDEAREPEHPAAHIGWKQYTYNCLAGIMRNLTGVNLPQSVPFPGRPGDVIEHQYLHIK